MSDEIYDVAGIGIGPFNLGLAALAASMPALRARFFDARPSFDWHSGMMIPGTTLQVPFLADLVTAADPTSPYSFLAYMKRTGRLYQFAIREAYFVTRKQYNQYCQWVSRELASLEFGTEIHRLDYDRARSAYRIEGRRTGSHAPVHVYARNVVIGVGTSPRVPSCVPKALSARVVHSSRYLEHRDTLLGSQSVLLVGSGQSAAEIFYDLLESKHDDLDVTWLTRSERFFPMDYSKLALELASPDYVDHFHRLPADTRRDVLARQDALYRGISAELIARIYDRLYDRSVEAPRRDVRLGANAELVGLRVDDDHVVARFRHRELDARFERSAERLVLATGYEYRIPTFLDSLRDRITWDATGSPRVNRNYAIACEHGGLFVQNAVPESHGFTASDLSLGPYRNALILNAIAGREHFAIEARTAFQDFGVPGEGARSPERDPLRQSRSSPVAHAERV